VAAPVRAGVSRGARGDRGRSHARRATSAIATSRSEARRHAR
jgi:hypothetical protein